MNIFYKRKRLKVNKIISELLIYTCKINYFDELSRRMKFL